MTRSRCALVLFCCASLPAQRGDRDGETQTPLPADLPVPPASVRTPDEELVTLRVQPGFAVELVAAEPLVGDPVAVAFDAAGRMWVVEMRGFMNDVDATAERAANGRIVVLQDRDSDGRMDSSTVFRDGLALPRAVLPLHGGALVLAPPHLLWCRDADGDLRADQGGDTVVLGGFEAGLDNPEHAGNGLLWGLDHRIHLANDKRMLRWTPGGFVVEDGAGGGQWGITHDDRGRLYFNYNEDWLRCDLVPGRHGVRAAAAGGLLGLNHRLVEDRSVWPIRMTPGVNRGYQPGRLRDWVLAIHTAVCAPLVYRSDLLPGCAGSVFVCEPAGHVVRRVVLTDEDAAMHGANAYHAARQEFLASTDERFRPVNLAGGADGALYVVDMYRGVIQHKNFVTSFLRRQILQRGLERPTGLGRIWRVVPAEGARRAMPDLARAGAAALVDALATGDGPCRDLAVRELVLRGESTASDALRARLRRDPAPARRIVLLSALAGLGTLRADDLRFALHDDDAGVLAFALTHVGPWLAAGDGVLWSQIELRVAAAPPGVAWHAALAAGDVLAGRAPPQVRARGFALLARLGARSAGDAILRSAIVAASHPAELDVLRALPAAPEPLLEDLARGAIRSRDPAVQLALFDAAAARMDVAAQRALLRGALAALPKGAGRQGFLSFAITPPGLSAILRTNHPEVAPLATELLAAVALHDPAPAAPAGAELPPAEQQRVAAGQRVFASACAACHQLDGNGMAGLAPPLRDSAWVLGPADRLIRIALHGVRGPIEVDGTTWSLEMPGQGHLADADIAAALSWLRRAFGHRATTVTAHEVAAARAAHRARTEPWTAQELLGER
jgi:mono/diheme cytochrome c family protein/glucose/arabinose dehydrogenase